MTRSLIVSLAGVALMAGACSKDSPTIITPTPLAPAPVVPAPPPEVPAAPVARLGVTIDGKSGFAAVAAASTVAFDGTGSSGSGLRFGLDFGDGTGVDQASGSRVYQSGSRTYRVRLIVTDALGRTDTATADVTVKSVTGAWSNGIYNANARRYESRALNITQQNGSSVTGQYTHPEGWTTPFTGEVLGSRGARLDLTDGTITFASTDVDGFNPDLSSLSLKVRGGSADGLVLTFSRSGSSY